MYIALRRNEVKEKSNVNGIQRWMDGVEEPEPIWADGDKALSGSDEKGRTQRQTMALKNVAYRLTASISFVGPAAPTRNRAWRSRSRAVFEGVSASNGPYPIQDAEIFRILRVWK